MIDLLEHAKEDIQALCRCHGVSRLSAFGSAVEGAFGESSDVDFLVEFDASMAPVEVAEAFFSLKEALETRLGRPVDLVTPHALSNPWLRDSVRESEALLYAA
ncbi:nucleotidyltransferase domain-containing protein [Halomonas sp. BM-2019]|uniref:nucleotidyltransferase family protein n=1 Tax=Halomonas sp. BM-2019 TaxID=2811227 RepID=UPI001B3C217A|nr:MAG: nucleotidyltransferase domain-containing protein [Halomonas sp. BM-2019]